LPFFVDGDGIFMLTLAEESTLITFFAVARLSTE